VDASAILQAAQTVNSLNASGFLKQVQQAAQVQETLTKLDGTHRRTQELLRQLLRAIEDASPG
jgi:hypothetical protein